MEVGGVSYTYDITIVNLYIGAIVNSHGSILNWSRTSNYSNTDDVIVMNIKISRGAMCTIIIVPDHQKIASSAPEIRYLW